MLKKILIDTDYSERLHEDIEMLNDLRIMLLKKKGVRIEERMLGVIMDDLMLLEEYSKESLK